MSDDKSLAYSELKKSILSGQMLAGERLVTQQLADRLKLSRTPIREALARLESEGLVDRHANLGYFIRTMTFQEASHLFEARMVIEVANAYFAAQRVDTDSLEQMNIALREASAYKKKNEIGQFQRAARKFHECIAECCANTQLLRMFRQINDQIVLFGITLLRLSPERANEIEIENRKIFQAISDKQPELASVLMRDHITKGHSHFRKSIENASPELDSIPSFVNIR